MTTSHRRLVLGGVHVDGDAAAVVDDLDAAVGLQDDLDVRAVAGQRFVDRVVDDLVDQVVQAAGSGGADVHARAFPDSFQALEHRDVAGAVFTGRHRLRGGVRRSAFRRWCPLPGNLYCR